MCKARPLLLTGVARRACIEHAGRMNIGYSLCIMTQEPLVPNFIREQSSATE